MSNMIATLIAKGPLSYQHHYMVTPTASETADHTLAVPARLRTLASKGATVTISGGGGLYINIGGKPWAYEMAHLWDAEITGAPAPKSLPREVWQYLRLAMGMDGDTSAA